MLVVAGRGFPRHDEPGLQPHRALAGLAQPERHPRDEHERLLGRRPQCEDERPRRRGGVVEQAIASTDNNVQALALGGTKVFFAEFDDNAPATGTVQKVPMLEGTDPVLLARNLNGPGSVAVDGHKVFFSTKDCEIQTIPTGE